MTFWLKRGLGFLAGGLALWLIVRMLNPLPTLDDVRTLDRQVAFREGMVFTMRHQDLQREGCLLRSSFSEDPTTNVTLTGRWIDEAQRRFPLHTCADYQALEQFVFTHEKGDRQ